MKAFPLKEIRAYLASKPIDKAWIFGSLARWEETENSDIDIPVQFTQGVSIQGNRIKFWL